MRRVPKKQIGKKALLLTVPEASEMLGLSQWAVDKLCDSGHLDRIKVGRSVRISKAQVKALAKSGGVHNPVPAREALAKVQTVSPAAPAAQPEPAEAERELADGYLNYLAHQAGGSSEYARMARDVLDKRGAAAELRKDGGR